MFVSLIVLLQKEKRQKEEISFLKDIEYIAQISHHLVIKGSLADCTL